MWKCRVGVAALTACIFAGDSGNYTSVIFLCYEVFSELVHKVADSINPESQFNPKWKSEHESAMEIYEEIKERADAHKQAKISLM